MKCINKLNQPLKLHSRLQPHWISIETKSKVKTTASLHFQTLISALQFASLLFVVSAQPQFILPKFHFLFPRTLVPPFFSNKGDPTLHIRLLFAILSLRFVFLTVTNRSNFIFWGNYMQSLTRVLTGRGVGNG